jgi:DNA primase
MTIHELKQTTNIADVVGHYLNLKPNAAEFIAVCPFHDDQKPSLTVVPKKGIFKCHACGEGGDAFDFVQKYTGSTLPESIEIVKEITGNKTYHVEQKPKEIIKADASASQPFTTDAPTVYHYSETVKVTRDENKKIRPYTFSGGKWIAKAPSKSAAVHRWKRSDDFGRRRKNSRRRGRVRLHRRDVDGRDKPMEQNRSFVFNRRSFVLAGQRRTWAQMYGGNRQALQHRAAMGSSSTKRAEGMGCRRR